MADIVKFAGYDIKDKTLREDISETKTYLGYTDDNVIGLQADFENNVFTRLGGAVGKNAGSDFNVYNMYGNRKVCAVQDDGTISKWYGDTGYVEDGSIGQIMVRQPKFYYKVVPLKIVPISPETDENYVGVTTTEIAVDSTTNPVMINGSSVTVAAGGVVCYNGVYYEWDGTNSKWIAYTQTDCTGYHMYKANFYLSDKPLQGFKVHPAFIDANGVEKDCYYIGAYEASLYDVSESKYLQYDSWSVTEDGGVYTINALNTYLADAANDKLCSIAGVKPASGEYSTQFTRPNVNQMAKNRGTGWGAVNVKIASAEQLLQIIELGQFNVQNAIANGVVSYASGSHTESVFTGSTSNLGNGTGAAASSSRLVSDGTYQTNTNNGYKSIRYRGVENFWGNVWSYISGINIWGNGKMGGGEAYICDDFNFAESKNDGNYKPVGFTAAKKSGYIKYFGYSTTYDWLLFPSYIKGGNATLPIGDYNYVTAKLNAYRIAHLGGAWYSGATAGAFSWNVANAVGDRTRMIGGRLALV